jgi:hypothetical protein
VVPQEVEAIVGAFQRLIDERYRQKRRTVLIANMSPQDFAKRYGQRVARRVEEAGRIIDMGQKRLSGREGP